MNTTTEIDKQIEQEKQRLLNFASAHKRVFIFGSGGIGEGLLRVLQQNSLDPVGFLATTKHKTECMGKPVYSLAEGREFLTDQDGIIPAFHYSTAAAIKGWVAPAIPDVLDIDLYIILHLANEYFFYPLLDHLNKAFPLPKRELSTNDWNNILVIRLDMIGDVILTTPFLRELRKNFAQSHISVVIRRQWKKLFYNCPYIDELLLYDAPTVKEGLPHRCINVQEVSQKVQMFLEENCQGRQFDVVLLPYNTWFLAENLDELLLAYYSGARYRVKCELQYDIATQLFVQRMRDSFTLISSPKGPVHEVESMLVLLRDCGCTIFDTRMELWPSESERWYVSQTLSRVGDSRIFIAVGITASAAVRSWSAQKYRELILTFGEQYGSRVIFLIFGGKDAKEAANQLDGCYGNILDLTGKTELDTAAAFMERCLLYVGSNTGLLHIASAMQVPSVTLYAALSDGRPTDGDSPRRFGAWGVSHIDLVPPAGLDCCHRSCSSRFAHCINQITVEQVRDAMHKLLPLDVMRAPI